MRLMAAPAPNAEDNELVGKPVIGKNANGVLEVFEINAAGELRHRWQKESDGDWSSWSVLGDGFLPGLTVANDATGRMEVFVVNRTNKMLQCIRQRAANNLDWSNWKNLGGGAICPPVAVGNNLDGLLEVFAVNATNGVVKHLWQTGTDDAWSSWSNIGGALRPWLAIERNDDGRLELFGIKEDDHTLVHCWQKAPNARNGWSEWANLGGSILPGFTIAKNARGIVEVFAVNSANFAVNRICQISPSDSRQWTQWQDFGAYARSGLSVEKTGSGRLEIFAVDNQNSALLHRWELSTNGADTWSRWVDFGQICQNFPAVGVNEDGDLEIFAVDKEDGKVIHHRRQISQANGWLDWSTLDYRTLQYGSRTWQIDEGLPGNQVQAIAQTHDGYLWVGTREGLARFDGTHFTIFNSRNTPALKISSITALCADKNDALWIGTDGGGLARMKDEVFIHFDHADGLAGNKIHAICEANDGSLWIGTDAGMSRYKNKQFINYTTANGLLSDSVRYIYEDRSTNLWIATSKGLNRLMADATMDSFTMPNGLPNDSVRGICQDKGSRLWIGSNNGLLWYNAFWGRSFYAYNTRYGLSDTFVSAVCEDHDGNLWVGTYSGLNRFRQGRFYSQLDNEGLPFDKVNALFEDNQGDLWVGTQEGLVRLEPKRFAAYTRQNGLTHNNVTSVLQDRNGNFWIGTWGGGFNEMKDGKITAFTSTNGLSKDLILSLCEGHDGSIWVGADYDGGLTQLKNGKVMHYTGKDGLPEAGLKVLYEDSASNLWIGTSVGLYRLADGKIKKLKNQSVEDDIHTIYEDRAGDLWIGTENGLSCLKNGKFINFTTKNGLSDNSILSLFEDADNNLWIGTEAGGLNRFRNGTFTAYTTENGLFSNEIFSIVDDGKGWLWMSCSKGVFRIREIDLDEFDKGRKDTIQCIAYGKADGMESPQCNGIGRPASWKDRGGRLWFPTSKGLVTVDPAFLPPPQKPPAVYIEQVIVDRKPLIRSPLMLAANTAADNHDTTPLQIQPARGELQFEYTALNLSAPEKSRFKYKLEGIDSDWVDAGARHTAYYNNVPPGHYNFHVIACNKDGVWNKTGATLAIVLLPHYWQTWWFKVMMALLVIGGASGTALYLTRRKMQRRLELLKQRHAIEKERGRIAKDIHDDLGSNLTRITMLGERVEEGLAKHEEVGVHVRKIVDSARQTVQSMDEIVWAVNPENDTLDGLVGYISHYADEFFEGAGVRYRLEMPVELPRRILSAELRHNLFLMVKEAFNNALKHSQASSVTVRVMATDSSVQIVIEDNGVGFDFNRVASEQQGNGLANLSRRMENLGGQFQINTEPGKGVRLQFAVELPRRQT